MFLAMILFLFYFYFSMIGSDYFKLMFKNMYPSHSFLQEQPMAARRSPIVVLKTGNGRAERCSVQTLSCRSKFAEHKAP